MNKLIQVLPVMVALLLVSNPAMAGDYDYLGTLGLGAGVAIGFAALGGGIGQGIAASGALQGIARNPSAYDKIFTPMIIGLALIESLVIYALVIAFLLNGKIDGIGDAINNAGDANMEMQEKQEAAAEKKKEEAAKKD